MATPHRIIGIVFSAGGFDPLMSILPQLSADSGSVYVVLQHMSKAQENLLGPLLARKSKMPVLSLENNCQLQANHIYIGPPGYQVAMNDYKVSLQDRETNIPQEQLFDVFLYSLAREQRDRAVAVVLSGAGNDATKGAVAIRQAGGLVLVQDPTTAEFRSMPESVVNASAPDLILSPAKLGTLIDALAKEIDKPTTLEEGSSSYQRIVRLLYSASHVDFSRYKISTLQRRIGRRLFLNRMTDQIQSYIELLEGSEEELNALSRDLLIGVSSFFRDSDMFGLLSDEYLPEILSAPLEKQIRIWVAGCATGEEAYSYAIAILEHARTQGKTIDFKILASDLNNHSIKFAGRGIYPESIRSEVPADYLERYFNRVEKGYRICDKVREHLIYFQHDMTEDIPFTNIDLVSCRNVFIYFNPDIQKLVLRAFGFALRMGGLLVLSPSESIGNNNNFFQLLNERWRIYRLQQKPRIQSPLTGWRKQMDPHLFFDRKNAGYKTGLQEDGLRERLLLLLGERFVPLILVVNYQGEILYILGNANGILHFPSGEPVNDLSRLADPSLRLPITTGLKKMISDPSEIEFSQIPVALTQGQEAIINLRLVRIPGSTLQTELVAVLFEKIRATQNSSHLSETVSVSGQTLDSLTEQRVSELEEELFYTKQSLRTAVEELEATNEELQSANEEMQSGNEELQSANEELQSTNEELITVNNEYQEKVRELSRLNEDINNLMLSAEVVTVFVDNDRKVRLMSPGAQSIFYVIQQDLGRPITQLKHRLIDVDLTQLIEQVLTENRVFEHEGQTAEGITYLVRAHPFLSHDNEVSGVALNFVYITVIRETEQQMNRLAAVVTHARDAIILTDLKGNIQGWNGGAQQLYGWLEDEALNMPYSDLLPPNGHTAQEWIYKQIIEGRTPAPQEAVRMSKNGQEVSVWITYTPIYDINGQIKEIATFEQDITEKQQMEREIRLAAVAFDTIDGIMVTDANSRILRVNKAFTTITGYREDEVVGLKPSILHSGNQTQDFYKKMWQHLTQHGTWKGEIWNRNKIGNIYPEWLTINAVKDKLGKVTHYIGVFRDISDKKASEAEIHKLAFYDSLTGLPNRRLLSDRLTQAIAHAKRENGFGALMFLDIDRFKQINDSLGHTIGDRLLQKIANRLQLSLRFEDTIARIGGDEFIIVLFNIGRKQLESISFAETIARKILKVIDAPFEMDGHSLHTTASIGVTLFPEGEDTVEDLLRQADNAMYLAKKKGRNRMCFFDPSMQAAADAWLEMEKSLREATIKQQFELYYQPLVNSEKGCIGAEALVRWCKPDGTVVSPLDFIPMCEETGIILEVGRWILREACRQFNEWQRSGYHQLQRIAVNISPRQFSHDSFIEDVLQIVRDSGLPPHYLELELTENLLLDGIEHVTSIMHRLKDEGIRFSIDDFGTGYSSLAYIKRLPINKIKIDRTFIRDILDDKDDVCIVESIIAMGEKMGLELIAEGVETSEQLQLIRQMGCQNYQGYLFGKPLPPEAFIALLSTLTGEKAQQIN